MPPICLHGLLTLSPILTVLIYHFRMYGQYQTFITKYKRNDFNLVVRPIAAKMEPTGMLLAVLDHNPLYDAKRNKDAAMFNIIEIVRVRLDSPLAAWQKK